MPETNVKKRKQRRVLSCNDCRRRKLKCDRELPCNRCINGGIPESCAYAPDPQSPLSEEKRSRTPFQKRLPSHVSRSPMKTQQREGDTFHPLSSSSIAEQPGAGRVEQLESRVASLEALLSRTQASAHHSVHQYEKRTFSDSDSSVQLSGLFKGRRYATFFHGPTSPMAIISQFSQLALFMKEIYPGSTLERLTSDTKAIWDRTRANKVFGKPLGIPNLRSLLPDRPTVDILVKQYLETFETTFRILHIPTFLAAYDRFWEPSQEINTDMDAIVLSIMACTLCTSTHTTPTYDATGSTFRSKAIVWIKACDAWLKRQSNKHRNLASLQVRFLRLIALSTTCLKTKEYYQEVEAHMAFMRSAGMHRDPSVLGARCSVFEGEMRRRLWATSLELELQTSIDRGSPSMLTGLEYDCTAPRNINDSELQIDMTELRVSEPADSFTDTSFLHYASRTSSFRMKLCADTNRLHANADFPTILQYEQEIQDRIDQIPNWETPRSFQARSLLDLHLRQFLPILHAPRTLKSHFPVKSDQRYSILMCLQFSAELIEKHTSLTENGNFVLCCMRSDYYRAALLICYIAYHARAWSDAIILQVSKLTFDTVIEKALRLQEERAMRPGRGSHQYWYISAACSLVGIQFDPSQKEVFQRSAVERVARLLYRTLSLQENCTDESLASELILGDMCSFESTASNMSASFPTTLLSEPFPEMGSRLAGFDMVNTSDWILDDFYFG